MEAAVQAKQWNVVLQIADGLSEAEARPFILKVAKQLHESGDHAAAEKYYVRSGRPDDAVLMYLEGTGRTQSSGRPWGGQYGRALTMHMPCFQSLLVCLSVLDAHAAGLRCVE